MDDFIQTNRDLAKLMNRKHLLNIIRRAGKISRKQLTDVAGLSVGAVSGIVAELLDHHWILEIGEGEYTGGRRQTLIKLNPRAGYAVGLKLMERRMVIAVTNFESEIISYDESLIFNESSPRELANAIAQTVKVCMSKIRVKHTNLLGVGIGLAGVINSQTGVVHYSPFYGWRDVPLALYVQEALELPVTIENDVNTLTLTEQLFGVARNHETFLVVTIGRGIGMGLVVNNQIYRGSRGGAGEFGHTVMGASTLEMLASDPAIIARVGDTTLNTLQDVVDAAQAGHQGAIEALAYSGQQLGIALANVINLLNPPLIVISGEGTMAGDFRLKPMYEAIQKHTFDGLIHDVEIIIEPTTDKAWARGAASLVISKVFESPTLKEQAVD